MLPIQYRKKLTEGHIEIGVRVDPSVPVGRFTSVPPRVAGEDIRYFKPRTPSFVSDLITHVAADRQQFLILVPEVHKERSICEALATKLNTLSN